METAVVFTSYKNGTIRNAEGKLIAFYDAEAGTLVIDSNPQTFHPDNLEHAMDMVSFCVK